MLYPEYHKKHFSERRQNVVQLIKDSNPFLIVLLSSPVYPMGSDAHYPYKADSSFFYLTGLLEEESAALIGHENNKISYELFVRPKNPEREQWDGYRLGPDAAQKQLQADKAHTIDKLQEQIHEWFKRLPKGSSPRIYSNFTTHSPNHKKLHDLLGGIQENVRAGVSDAQAFIEVLPLIRKLRSVKDEHELKEMRASAKINVEAHLEAMQKVKPNMTEYEVQSIIEGTFLKRGARGPGYSSIIASGPNATILHYHENSRKMKDGELLLIDAGCDFRMYQSDITRTLPVGKKYSPLQRKLMDIVLEAHQAASEVCVEGRTIKEFHTAASMALIEGLKSLKILKGSSQEIFDKGLHKKYYPHGTGHHLGLDVHDPCPNFENGKDVPFKKGMIMTVEPGLYFKHDDKSVDKEFRGLGIRIEDNLVINSKGKKAEVLTADLPRSWQEIEKIRSKKQS